MNEIRKNRTYRISYLFFLNLSIVCAILLFMHKLRFLHIDLVLSFNWLFAILVFSALLAFLSRYKRDLSRYHVSSLSHSIFQLSPYFFLSILLILALNQFLKLDFITQRNLHLTIFGIAFGFLTFYKNRDQVERQLQDEKHKEDASEQKRKSEFASKFPGLARFNFEYGVSRSYKEKKYFLFVAKVILSPFVWLARLPYTLVKWMYGEGWWYSGALIGIVVIGFVLRVWDLDYLEGTDNFTANAIRGLYENGSSFYKIPLIEKYLMLFFTQVFNYNIIYLRLSGIFFSILSLILLYFISKKFDKKIALLSVFLFAISPWSIILSRSIRSYSFDLFVCCISFLFSLKLLEDKYKSKSQNILQALLFLVFLVILCVFNQRYQTLVAAIYPATAALIILLKGIVSRHMARLGKIEMRFFLQIFIVLILFIAGYYFADYSSFKKGLFFNNQFIDYFFNASSDTPWHWFYNTSLSSLGLLVLFFVPLLISIKLKKEKSKIYNYLYVSFFIGLFLFITKFVAHAGNYPTRYVYFLFIPYLLILSSSFFFISKTVTNKRFYLVLVLILFFFINWVSLSYAISPNWAYASQKLDYLQIDNIGIGKFNLLPVENYIKNDLQWNEKKPTVFAGRFAEFIYLLNYSIDPNRGLNTKDCSVCSPDGYDIGKKAYVESYFWNIHELEKAVTENNVGYYITEDHCVSDSLQSYTTKEEVKCIVLLGEKDFEFGGKTLVFKKRIGNYKIYTWGLNT